MDVDKQKRLRSFLEKIAPQGSLESMAESVGGAGGLEAAVSPAGRAVVKKLSRNKPLDRAEQFHLEAIIIPDKRPAIDIIDGSYKITHPLWRHWNNASIRKPLQRAIPSIGCIELRGHPRLPYGGTGFVVGDGLMMTNRHVAELFSSGLGLRTLNFLPGRRAAIDFRRERDSTTSVTLGVRRVVMIHPYWDVALLEVDGLGAEHAPLPLAMTPTADLASREVALVGYPAFDPRNPVDVQTEVFGGVYEIKRLQPGRIGAPRQVDSFGHNVDALTHDASTLGGNSGSAALDPTTGEVLALHFSGVYLDANFGVPAYELSRDGRIIDAGVQFTGSPRRSGVPWDSYWSGNEAGAVPAPGTATRGPTPSNALPTATTAAQVVLGADGSATFSVPLQITVRLGPPVPDAPAAPAAPLAVPPSGGGGSLPAASPAVSDEGESIFALWRAQAGAAPGPGARFVLNFARGRRPADADTAAAINRATGLQVEVGELFAADPDLDVHRLVKIPAVSRLDRSDMFEIARIFRDISGAETVDPDLGSDYYDWPETTPGSGRLESLAFWCWADDSTKPANADWAITATRVPEAWAFSESTGQVDRGAGIRIFQADTGIVVSHPEMPPGTVGNPGAGNFIEPGQPPIDPMAHGLNPGHGTGTASVAASPETLLMRGSAPKATLVPVRCIESVAVFDQSPVAQAINHARLNGADIITMSLGGVFSGALHAALRKAVAANIIVVAAAGNCVGAVVWPARYEEAIAVGGINAALQAWKGSSRGPEVDISGPAEFVLNADPRVSGDPAAVTAGQGTSYATAHLAGVAALWLAHHGRARLEAMLPSGVTLQEVFRTLLARSSVMPPGFDTANFGAGIVNAEALLQEQPAGALGLEAVSAAPVTDIRRQVADLVAQATGPGGLEAASPALGDLQNAAELACVALDQLRRVRRRRSTLESLPPPGLSPGLRRAIGPGAVELVQPGGRNG